jgi:hypothetical protein
VVALFAGEFASYNFNAGFPRGGGGGGQTNRHFLAADFPNWEVVRHLLPWILASAVAIVILFFLLLYVHAVFRFILFDSVLTGRCSIGQSWGQYKNHGARYFVWLLIFNVIAMTALFAVVGLPLLGLWHAGILSHSGGRVALMVLVISLTIMGFFAIALVSWVIMTIVKDLLVPIMALENTGVAQAWRSYQPMLAEGKGSLAAYLGMKLVLALLLGMIVGTVSFFVILILLIPSVVYFLVAFGLMSSGKVGLIVGALLMAFGIVVLVALMFSITGGMSVPVAVFFQSYALYYLGSRYQRLGDVLWPAPPTSGPLPASPAPA